MTCIHTSRLYFGLLFLFLSFQRCCSAADLNVQCTIINAEYVECFWHPNTSTANYTFSSQFLDVFQDCPEYIMKHNYTVGCRTPLKDHDQRFDRFSTNVSTERNHTISKTFESLKRKVQLNPPCNLSVKWNEQEGTLLLYWNSSTPLKETCVVYMVRNQKDISQTTNVTGKSYSLSQVSQNKPYVFQVRSTVSNICGGSDLWSNWSDPIKWGSTGNISRQGWWDGLYGILALLLLLPLCLLLCYCERKRIILLPVVPDPSKNLQDLFHKHDGNVESWVHISRELKEAFEPDYTEPSCDVCEVVPSCDTGPTSVVSPDAQTDNCDEPSAEEEHANEPRTEEESADEQGAEEEYADKPGAEEERADEPNTEEPAEPQTS
ncbi:interleukin 2 receptor, gamma b [Labeo rohita]|uniref:interleukin 2 receptor, gamma b n=1 Tax=Labeo rohita TaxID=84645 RepID=UPI0021E25AF1|nr:interleukin 2 receptor, gamma b [Labeo rohita]